MGPAIIRCSRTSFKAARKFLTTWRMSTVPLWAHPCLISVKQQQKRLKTGRDTTFYSMELKWLVREAVPPNVQDTARSIHDQVKQAHAGGNLVHDETFGDEEAG
jgi:hypothetical protein